METNKNETVTIPREEYDHLMYTKFVFDFKAAELCRNVSTGGYISNEEKIMYHIADIEVE